MKPGRFIALEGGEGTGKSTQTRLLGDALRARGLQVVTTREPGGTAGAEAIRQLLLNTEGEGWNPRAESLLFAAARSDHVERIIRPAVAAGKWVLCDRFVDSSRAYQGGTDGLSDQDILTLHEIGSHGLLPDLALLIDVAPEELTQRLARRDGRTSDRIGGRDSRYHARVRENFQRFADAEPHRFVRIDGNGKVEVTHEQIMTALAPLLELTQ